MSDPLKDLQAWYEAQCDGDWEHQGGVEIETLDNPGWRLRVNLRGTALQSRTFEALEEKYDDPREWIRCWVADESFHAACGPNRLGRAIEIFVGWAGHEPVRSASGAS